MLIIGNIEMLRDCVTALYEVASEAKFTFNENEMSTSVADSQKVALSTIVIKKEAFKAYEVEPNTVIAMRLEPFLIMLDKMDKDTEVKLSLDENAKKLILNGETSGATCRVQLANPAGLASPNIKILPKMKIDIPVSMLKKIIKAGSKFDNIMKITTKDKKFCMAAIDEAGDNVRMEQNITADDVIRSNYGLDYIETLLKIIPNKVTTISLYFDNDFPAIFEFSLAEGATAKYIIAPRVES